MMEGMKVLFLATLLSRTADGVNPRENGGGGRTEVEVVEVDVPGVVKRGEEAVLGCRWGGGGGDLYSLKWYLDDKEFFGYLPDDKPSILSRPLPGVNVDHERSTGEVVVLVDVGVSAGGRYKCEVVGAPPTFLTADKSATLTVMHLPESGPLIYGARNEYHPGELARLTCLAPRAVPPPKLQWFINDEMVPASYTTGLNTSKTSSDGLVESSLGLRFKVEAQHFQRGQLKMRCAATIPGLYHKTRQYSVGDGPTQLSAPVMESRDSALTGLGNSVSSSSSSSSSSNSKGSSGAESQQVVKRNSNLLLTLLLTSIYTFIQL